MAEDKGFVNKESYISIGAVVAVVVVFGFWWNSVDPKPRLEKIEQTAMDLTKEFAKTYVTLREHNDLQARLKEEIVHLSETLKSINDTFLTKAEFEAWKRERDVYLATIVKNIDNHDKEINLKVDKTDCADKWRIQEKNNDILHHRVDLVNDRIQKIIDAYLVNNNTTIVNKSDKNNK